MHVILSPNLPEHQKYLKFYFRGKIYQFIYLPSGICSSPRKFTKLLKPSSFLSKVTVESVKSRPTCPRALRALHALRDHAPYVPYVPTCPSIHTFLRVLSLVLDLNFAIS